MRRPSLQGIVTAAVVAACAGFVFWQLEPSLLLADTTATGGDMASHVWGPAHLRDVLLPSGRLTGWAPDWYTGFPAYTFYFPLPGLLVVFLDLFLPYNVAFKLVTVLGAVSLPVAAWAFGRLSELRFPGPQVLAVATLPFLFDTSFTIYGGNLPSTLAGEFSFSISLSLALVFLGVVARGLETGKHRALAAVLLALTGLSHIIPTMFAVAAAGVLLLLRLDGRRLWYLITVGAAAAGLVGFWAFPFLMNLPYTNDMGWEKATEYLRTLFPSHMTWVLPMAVAGVIGAVGLRVRTGMALAGMAVVTGLAFIVLPQGRIWNARLLPFWFLCAYLLAGFGFAEIGRAVGGIFARDPDRPAKWPGLVTPIAGFLAGLFLVAQPLNALPGFLPVRSGLEVSFVPGWAQWNYSGYEAKEAYPEYRDLIETMGDLPCGRAMWEYSIDLGRFGSPMALMLLPYWTDGCIQSMEGLFFESTATVPFHFINQSELSTGPSRPMRGLPYGEADLDAGIRHLQLMGVRYYMAFSEEILTDARDNEDLRKVAESGDWEVFEISGSPLVEPMGFEPVVVEGATEGREAWLDVAVPFYQSLDFDVFPAAEGPDEWAHIEAGADFPRRTVASADVGELSVDTDRLSFEVDRTGVPILVKTSYFPNWKAEGAEGPYRVAPNFMAVVPTDREVELRYGYTAADFVGWLLTLAGVASLFVMSGRPLRMRARREYAAIPPIRDRESESALAGIGARMVLRRLGVVTLVVTALDVSILVALRLSTGIPVIVAGAVSVTVASIASYLIHRSITFGDDPHVRWVREPATFFWITFAAGAVDLVVLRVAVEILGSTSLVPLVAAKFIALAAAGATRAVAYRNRLFLRVREGRAVPPLRAPAPGRVRLSVVLPSFSDEERIGGTIARVREALTPLGGDLEIIVVDDGSSDETASAARLSGADEVIRLPHNQGKGAAVRAGVIAARGRTIVFTDSDLSYPPEQILRLLEEVERGWDLVAGSRRHIETRTLVEGRRLRALGGRVYNSLTRAVLLGQYRDTQCGLKAFRSDVARTIFSKTRLDGFAFDVEVFHLAERYRLALREVPVDLAESETSTVRYAIDAVRMVRDLFRIRLWSGRGLYDVSLEEGVSAESEGDREMREIAEKVLPLPGWLRGRDLTPWVAGGLAVLWAAVFIYLGASRHHGFGTFGFDLGVYDQGLWLLSRFKEPFITIRGLNFFGHHMNPTLLLLVPFYWLAPGPMVLLVSQVVSQAAASFGVYLLARDRLEDRLAALGLGAVLLLHPSWQWQVWWFFHPEVIGASLLVFAYWAAVRQRWGWFAVTAALALGTKEEVAFAVAIIGVLVALRGRWQVGLGAAGVSALWFVGSTEFFLPAFNAGQRPWYFGFFAEFGSTPFEVARTALTRPRRTLAVITQSDRLQYLKFMFAPVALLPIARLDVLLVGGAMLAINLLSSVPYHRDMRFQYSAIVVAAIAIATVEGVRLVGRTRTTRRVLVGLVVLASSLSSVAWGPSPLAPGYEGLWRLGGSPAEELQSRALSLIPDGASVSTSFYFSPHLTDRERVYEFPVPWTDANWGLQGENLHDPDSVEWLLVDRGPLGDDHAELLDRLLEEEFEVVFDEGPIVVARRAPPDASSSGSSE